MNYLKPHEFEQYLNTKNFRHFRFQSADQYGANKDAPVFDLHFNRIEIFHNPDRVCLSQGFNSVVFPLFRYAEVHENISVRGTVLLLSCFRATNDLSSDKFLILASE